MIMNEVDIFLLSFTRLADRNAEFSCTIPAFMACKQSEFEMARVTNRENLT